MKSEAEVFSIDDLASRPNQIEPWDGACASFFPLRNRSPSRECGPPHPPTAPADQPPLDDALQG